MAKGTKDINEVFDFTTSAWYSAKLQIALNSITAYLVLKQ